MSTAFPGSYTLPRLLKQMLWKLIWTGTFQNRFADKEFAINVYHRHNARVQQVVPKDQLLTLDITKNGGEWKNLCEFLNVPVPDVPFPHSNDTDEFERRIEYSNKIAWCIIIVGSSILAAGLGSLIYFYK